MCGISGIAYSSKSTRRIEPARAERMRDVLSHRGPDDAGLFISDRVALGHRRLSIVDVAAGHQPMSNEDESIHIVFNGEIYNHLDFREGLEAKGHRYRSHCDTETIVHLYEEDGPGCVNQLRGMFAFALWDSTKQELFLARDRLGVKPLYYYHAENGSLLFSSEIKSLLASEEVRPQLNYAALPDYLANHATSGDTTLFRGVKRLLPGHTLLWRDGAIHIERYWDISFDDSFHGRKDADLVEEWVELFRESVRLRLMADVPLGMFLSGGIDSSAIAAVMSRMVPDRIKTFSVAFEEREANELQYARTVAKAFNTDHHEVIVSAEQMFAALPRLIWHEDEPIAHPSSIPLFFVSDLASQHVKVVLTGEGSDELLAGYGRYRKTVYNLKFGRAYGASIPAVIRKGAQSAINRVSTEVRLRQKLDRTFLMVPSDIESIYFDNFAVFNRGRQRDMLSRETIDKAGEQDPYATISKVMEGVKDASLLNQLLYVDSKTYLHELLMKQDQMSMAASIESRVPFLDHKLVEFTSRLPEHLKLNGWTTKYVLRKSMQGVLPQEILKRPKMGFPVPLARWFKNEFAHVLDEYVLGRRAVDRGIFKPEYTRTIVKEHRSGRFDHSERLWSLMNFEIWMRAFIDGEEFEGAQTSEMEVAALA
jgi:asparagine synthase (glutamine-hydrolysing)